ncbi:transcriptional regulator, partial [Pediococcus acidilactici]
LGYFSDFSVQPSCGLASPEKVIGKMDDLRSFVSNERVDASLLWFSDGYVEYIFPNPLEASDQPELLDISLELSSKFPVSNNNWP